MNSSIDIREMAIDDHDAALALWQNTEGVSVGPSDSRENMAKYLARNPGLSFVAKDGPDVVGAVICGTDGRRGYLNHLAVRPSHRKLGIGKTLVERCLAALAAMDIPRCNLFVLAGNAGAIAFWRKLGWRFGEDRGVRAMSFEIRTEG